MEQVNIPFPDYPGAEDTATLEPNQLFIEDSRSVYTNNVSVGLWELDSHCNVNHKTDPIIPCKCLEVESVLSWLSRPNLEACSSQIHNVNLPQLTILDKPGTMYKWREDSCCTRFITDAPDKYGNILCRTGVTEELKANCRYLINTRNPLFDATDRSEHPNFDYGGPSNRNSQVKCVPVFSDAEGVRCKILSRDTSCEFQENTNARKTEEHVRITSKDVKNLHDECKEAFSLFAERASLPGVKFLHTSPTTCARVAWFVFLMTMLGALTLHLFYLVNVYTSWPKSTRVSLGFDALQFPAVTFCNANPARASKLSAASADIQELVWRTQPRNIISQMMKVSNSKTDTEEEAFVDTAGAETTTKQESNDKSTTRLRRSPSKLVEIPEVDLPVKIQNTGLELAGGQESDTDGSNASASVLATQDIPNSNVLSAHTSESITTKARDNSKLTSTTLYMTTTPQGSSEKVDSIDNRGIVTTIRSVNKQTPPKNSYNSPSTNFGTEISEDKGTEIETAVAMDKTNSKQTRKTMRFINNLDLQTANLKSKIKQEFYDKEHAAFSKPSVASSIADQFVYLFARENRTARINMGHQIEDMLVDCSFNGGRCYPGNFTLRTSSTLGNCFTLDHDNMEVTRSGPKYGLTLVIFLEREEFLTGLTSGSGGYVVIHGKRTFPFPDEDGLAVAAGMEVNIAINLMHISRKDKPFGECNDGRDFFSKSGIVFTRRTCQHFCEQSLIINICGCYDDEQEEVQRLYKGTWLVSGRSCKTEKDLRCMLSVQKKYVDQKLDCKCGNPCSEIVYTKSMSLRQWPSDEYADILLEALCQSRSQEECEAYRRTDKRIFAQNFMKVNIFYEDLNYENLTELASYEPIQFFSDIGGALGLWLGVSVMTVVEIGHLLISLLRFGIASLCKKF